MNMTPSGCDTASRHALALTDECASGEAIAEAMAWADSDPANRQRLDEAMQFLSACDRVRAVLPNEDLQSPLKFRTARFHWAAPLAALAASVLVLISGVVLVALGYAPWSTPERDQTVVRNFASSVGQTRTIRLSDQDSVILAGDTAVKVSYGKRISSISLLKGQALFRLEASKGESIAVDAGPAAIQTTKAQVDVNRGEAGSVITVVDGAVLVNAALADDATALGKGMQLTAYTDGTVSPVSEVDPDTVTSWYRGAMQFASEKLSRVVEQLNRYSKVRIVLDTPGLGEERVSGMVELDRIGQWLNGLSRTLNVDVVQVRGGPVILRRKLPSVDDTKSLEKGTTTLI